MNYQQHKISMFLYLLSQQAIEDTNYLYVVDSNNEATLILYRGNFSNIKVPQYIDGYKVTHIECTCYNYNKNIQSVIIPEGITTIN